MSPRSVLVVGASTAFALLVGCSSNDALPPASGTSSGSPGASNASSGATGPDGGADAAASDGDASSSRRFEITSTAFAANAAIPVAQSCDAAGGASAAQSPPLAWVNAPTGTQSFAVVMTDLSLTTSSNFHWVIYDMPATATGLTANVAAQASITMPFAAKQSKASFGTAYGYYPPCPPSGTTHRYELKLYAVSVAHVSPLDATNPESVELAIQGNLVATTQLVGTYHRP